MIFINPVVDRGAKIYMHTYNDMEEVDKILSGNRAYGVYTDSLPSDSLDHIKYPYDAE